jgi:hypothetical protein
VPSRQKRTRFVRQNALDAETAIAEAPSSVENKRADRDAKVATLQAKIARVINGVVGYHNYGPDSDLYGAMGYVRKFQRKSGPTQKSNVPPPTPPAH